MSVRARRPSATSPSAEGQPNQEITALLRDWRRGAPDAVERLFPLVYNELRRVARARLRGERPGHTLQATALVNEAYLRLMGPAATTPQNRCHLFALAARAMRQILVDHARKKHADKRGAGATMVTLPDGLKTPQRSIVDVLAIDEALIALAALDPRLVEIVELKFFAGLNIEETAEALGVSHATVERDWRTAKAWLRNRLSSEP